MSAVAWVLATAAATAAAGDWWAVQAERPRLRHWTKPAALVLLIGVAVVAEPVDTSIRAWMVAGLVLSLGGDVLLMLPERWFVAGLGSFLLAHVAYVVGLQIAPLSLGWSAAGLGVVVAGGLLMGRPIVSAVRSRHAALTAPVVAYLVVISAMVVSAFGTSAALAVGGATLFYVSDATLAWNRFVEPLARGPLAVMVTYHLGQAGLVAWVVAG